MCACTDSSHRTILCSSSDPQIQIWIFCILLPQDFLKMAESQIESQPTEQHREAAPAEPQHVEEVMESSEAAAVPPQTGKGRGKLPQLNSTSSAAFASSLLTFTILTVPKLIIRVSMGVWGWGGGVRGCTKAREVRQAVLTAFPSRHTHVHTHTHPLNSKTHLQARARMHTRTQHTRTSAARVSFACNLLNFSLRPLNYRPAAVPGRARQLRPKHQRPPPSR